MDISDCHFFSIPHKDTKSFSSLINDYLNHDDFFNDFIQFSPNWSGLEKAIIERQRYEIDRQVLHNVLKKQYENRDTIHKVDEQIDALLLPNTFTVCSAHQPNLMTGHLYFFFKIIHSIVLSDKLKEKYPQYNFVPVFYIGSEDNDFDELNHFSFRDQEYKWETAQTGAVGRMRGYDLDELKKNLFQVIGNHEVHLREIKRLIDECYNPQLTIAEGTARFLHELLGDRGLVVINPDDHLLKANFSNVIKDELLNSTSHRLVTVTSERLNEKYHSQAFIREINLFYLKENIRERIIKDGSRYLVNNTDIVFSQQEILDEVDMHPERFSPNVILRGTFQESILPNVAFIGGGSEVAYWLQLKDLFAYHNVFFPAVILRQSMQLISSKTFEIINKNTLSWEAVFDDKNSVIKDRIIAAQPNIDLQEERLKLSALVQDIQSKVGHIDTNLLHTASAMLKNVDDLWTRLEKKMYKAEKKKWQILEDQLTAIHDHVFPQGTLQERKENVLEYYTIFGSVFFDIIYAAAHPFGDEFSVIVYNINNEK